jgi:SpoIID/LytB domain protein
VIARTPVRRAAALIAVTLAVSLLSPASGHAAEPRTFTFYGSGYGHGLGLPQWGAYGLAKKGWSQSRILEHFYQSTKVGPAPSVPSKLRIGLVQTTKTLHVSAVSGSVALRVGSTQGKLIGGRSIQKGETWRVLVDKSGRYRVLTEAGKMVGGHLWGGVKTNLFATYANIGKVRVPQAGHTYNRGYLEFNLYASKSCPNVPYCERLIIALIPQSYLYGLAEVPSGWPMTALGVQAVAARTYAFEKVKRVGQHRPICNCGLYDDTRDQVYAGWDKEGGPLGSRWVTAVQNTNRVVVLYNGAPIQAYYHSASGGYTEHNELQWGGTPLPYLRGVCDPGDYTEANPNTIWKVGPLSDATVTTRLRPYTGNIGTVTKFADPVRGVSGRMVKVTVVGTSGQASLNGTELRRGLGLKDNRVSINANGQVTGVIRTRYDRLMCAPGMPTSSQQAVPGGTRQRFAVGALYWNQARGVAFWVRGPVYDKYRALGESGGLLGMPRSDAAGLDLPGCTKETCWKGRFEKGYVYFKEGIGDGDAHELHGDVLHYYVSTGEASGHLGFPVTDVTLEPDGTTWARFEFGVTVSCSASGECVEK